MIDCLTPIHKHKHLSIPTYGQSHKIPIWLIFKTQWVLELQWSFFTCTDAPPNNRLHCPQLLQYNAADHSKVFWCFECFIHVKEWELALWDQVQDQSCHQGLWLTNNHSGLIHIHKVWLITRLFWITLKKQILPEIYPIVTRHTVLLLSFLQVLISVNLSHLIWKLLLVLWNYTHWVEHTALKLSDVLVFCVKIDWTT